MDAWECFNELNDPEFPSGWGPDLWFEGYCIKTKRVKNANLAVIDLFLVDQVPFATTMNTTSIGMMPQVTEWKKSTSRNFELHRTRFDGTQKTGCL